MASKQKVTLNPDMRSLTLEEVKVELPKKIRYIKTVREQMESLQKYGPAWMALAKSHDAVVLEARRYQRFINAHRRAEIRQAQFIAWIATPQAIEWLQELVSLIGSI